MKGKQSMRIFKICENLSQYQYLVLPVHNYLSFVVLCLPNSTHNKLNGVGMEGVKEPFLVTLKNCMTNSKSGQGHNAKKGLLVQHLYSQS